MAEETHKSAVAAPRGIIFTCMATGIGGLITLFGLLFAFDASVVDDYMLAGTGNSVSDIFIYVTGSNWGQGLTWLVVINLWFAGVSSVAVTGRITYALCRDGAFAYSEFLSQINPYTKSPTIAIMFVFVFDALLLLLPLNPKGALAFYAIVGLSTFGFQVFFKFYFMNYSIVTHMIF
jgi:amino acid transporter